MFDLFDAILSIVEGINSLPLRPQMIFIWVLRKMHSELKERIQKRRRRLEGDETKDQ